MRHLGRDTEQVGKPRLEFRLGELAGLECEHEFTGRRVGSQPRHDRVLVEALVDAELLERRERTARQHTAVVHEQTTAMPVLRTHSV